MSKRNIMQVVLAVFAALALAPRMGAVQADGDDEMGRLRQELSRAEFLAAHYAAIVAACLNGSMLVVGAEAIACTRRARRAD